MKYFDRLLALTSEQRVMGWLVHAFTASGAFVGLMALYACYYQKPITAFWMMAIAILIDAVDGMFARRINIKSAVPEIDGALLDNIVDFFTYTIVPAFFLLVIEAMPIHFRFLAVLAITFSSAYQFTQVDAKTEDHFFKGFPSYWNIVVFYLFFLQMNGWINLFILLAFAALSFIPIKYVYPSRLDYISHNNLFRATMLVATIIWGVATAGLLWVYPKTNHILLIISMVYVIMYIIVSLYRTFAPLAMR